MSADRVDNSPQFLVLAHRGLVSENAPFENTIAAFKNALSAGADRIETDVQVTSDGIAIVFHDADLRRFIGESIRVKDSTFEDLKGKLATIGLELPSLESVLSELPDAIFNIDVKDARAAGPVATVINRLNAQNRVLITSFSRSRRRKTIRAITGQVAQSSSAVELLWLYLLVKLRLTPVIKASVASLQALQIPRASGFMRFDTAGFIGTIQRAGVEVHYWTINSPIEIDELVRLGANGIVTDRCDLAVNIRRNWL